MAKDWVGGNAAVFKTLGASNHTDAERQREDYYATEPKATEWLCKLERFEGRILEPSCGEGRFIMSIIRRLKESAFRFGFDFNDAYHRNISASDIDEEKVFIISCACAGFVAVSYAGRLRR